MEITIEMLFNEISAIKAEMVTKAELAEAKAEMATKAELATAVSKITRWVIGLFIGSILVISTLIGTYAFMTVSLISNMQ